MKETTYDWKQSRRVYELFTLIYKHQPIRAVELAKLRGTKINVICDQLKPLKDQGIVKVSQSTMDKRDKWLYINKKVVCKKVKGFLFDDQLIFAPKKFASWEC